MGRIAKDIFALLFVGGGILAIIAAVIIFGFGWIVDSGANMVESVSEYGESRQQTRQVEVIVDGEVRIAEIEWNGQIRIAEIEAGARERTSGWGLAHRGADGLQMVFISLLAMVVVVGFIRSISGIEKDRAVTRPQTNRPRTNVNNPRK